jgi:hypothetical protein
MKNALRRLSSLSPRHYVALAVFSLLVCLGLAVANLAMAARTESLSRELDRLYASGTDLTRETNEYWTAIGRVASIDEMERRARKAGFAPTDKLEYLQPAEPVPTPTITATLTLKQP